MADTTSNGNDENGEKLQSPLRVLFALGYREFQPNNPEGESKWDALLKETREGIVDCLWLHGLAELEDDGRPRESVDEKRMIDPARYYKILDCCVLDAALKVGTDARTNFQIPYWFSEVHRKTGGLPGAFLDSLDGFTHELTRRAPDY
jgi:hypothetical protein